MDVHQFIGLVTDDKHTITFRSSDKDKLIMQIRDPNWTHFMVL